MSEPADTPLQSALAAASIPTLLMCLAQITGDDRWLEPPYTPQRDVALFADPSGGLPDAVQQSVRDAVAAVLAELDAGERTLPGPPSPERALRMMRVCLGENIAAEYTTMAMEEMGFAERTVKWQRTPDARRLAAFRVLVIGAGVSGLCAGIRLQELGIHHTIVEKNPDVGGTWYDNDYPDAGVDTPNHFYSYSFAPNPRWTSNFSKRGEVWRYLREVADRYRLRERIRFDTEVAALRWDDAHQHWVATLRGPGGAETTETADVVITAVGQLNRPKLANFPGMESFTGPWWHSSQWRKDVPLAGKHVAVVGTGASAMQFLPRLAEQASRVTVFQRSPQWARNDPSYRGGVAPAQQWLHEHVPYYSAWYRFGLMWRYGDGLLATLRRDPDWPHPERSMNRRNDRHRQQMTDHILQQLAGRDDLIAKALPDYPPYGKRILIDNGWYEALRRPNVELVTEAVARVDGPCIVTTSGTEHRPDVIVLATGFEAGRMLAPMDIRGRSGTPIREAWGDDDPRAYLGTTVADYPNLFLLSGPNTGLAHGGSLIFMTECQMRYIGRMLCDMIEQGIGSFEVDPAVQDRYCTRVDAEHAELVWTHPGMRNWYRNDRGRVFSPTPWRLVDFWQMTRTPDWAEYRTEPARAADGHAVRGTLA